DGMARNRDPGAVDQHVDFADVADRAPNASLVRDVERCEAEVIALRRDTLLLEIADGDIQSVGSEPMGDRRADALRASRDKGDGHTAVNPPSQTTAEPMKYE